ncbi:hypothetical protein AX769_20795 (plasmid) [Frondihabitans sp. PAMC 28766]|nr:hypothetical protein AX769_20795 [Frondihabitans sp. PAMC 28766]
MNVREDLVDDVTKFIATRLVALESGPSDDSSLSKNPANEIEAREWTVPELRMLKDGATKAKSIGLFNQVLDILAREYPRPVSTAEIGDELRIEGVRIQNSFGRATVWIRNRTDGDKRWPIYWAGRDWTLSAGNAERWRSLG